MRRVSILAVALCVSLLSLSYAWAQGAPARAYDPRPAPVSVEIDGERVGFDVFAIYRMPGDTVHVRMPGDTVHVRMPGDAVHVRMPNDTAGGFRADAGKVAAVDGRSWQWTVPTTPGLYRARVRDASGKDAVRVNLFVMVPREKMRGERLGNYRIGSYPDPDFKNLPIYQRPEGFVEVTREILDTELSPHFTLSQFLCKQESEYPKYVVLRERLLIKLEQVLAAINARGIRADGLSIMSGYRTPTYNRAIGNVAYSRHLWGGAADVFVDESPRDGVMDDLNGDGRISVEDAQVLYGIVEDMQRHEAAHVHIVGGLGLYDSTPAHGPFVHVDVRGTRARWGR
jgi:hypothetical protein